MAAVHSVLALTMLASVGLSGCGKPTPSAPRTDTQRGTPTVVTDVVAPLTTPDASTGASADAAGTATKPAADLDARGDETKDAASDLVGDTAADAGADGDAGAGAHDAAAKDGHQEHRDELDGAVPGVARMRFPLKAFPPEDQENAEKASRRGARYERKKQWGKAIGAYQKALTLDPNSWYRYELMATYLKAQLKDPALGMLKELRVWADSKFECFICKVWLAKTRKDPQFSSLHGDPRYKALVKGVSLKEPDYELLAKKFLAEVEAGLKDMLKATLERQMTLRVLDKTRTVDAKSGEDSDWTERTFFFSTFEEVEKASMTKYDTPRRVRCRSRCCRLTYPKAKLVPSAPPADVGKTTEKGATPKVDADANGGPAATATKKPTEPCDFNRLDKICFWPLGKNTAAIVRIEQRLCEVKAMSMDDLIHRVGKDGWKVPPTHSTDGVKTPPSAEDPNAERPPGKPTVIHPPAGL